MTELAGTSVKFTSVSKEPPWKSDVEHMESNDDDAALLVLTMNQ